MERAVRLAFPAHGPLAAEAVEGGAEQEGAVVADVDRCGGLIEGDGLGGGRPQAGKGQVRVALHQRSRHRRRRQAVGIKDLGADSGLTRGGIAPGHHEATIGQGGNRGLALIAGHGRVHEELDAAFRTIGLKDLAADRRAAGVATGLGGAGIIPSDHETALAQRRNGGAHLVAGAGGVDQKLAAALVTCSREDLAADGTAIEITPCGTEVGPGDYKVAVA